MMENKRIAYLIEVHANPGDLYDLVRALDSNNVSFFIHVDKKSNLEKFTCLFQDSVNVFFVGEEDRERVHWKGFSQVKAIFKMIDIAMKLPCKYKYFILLSGSDYPIKSKEHIEKFFTNSQDNYIEYKKIEKSSHYLDYFKNKQLWFKISKYHFYDKFKINWNSRNNSFKHWMYRLYIFFNICIINIILPKKNINISKDFYFGSSWWCINGESMLYIYHEYKSGSKINEVFKFSDAPDEMYFQTLLLNSIYKNNIRNDNLHYIDWDKNREGPALLDIGDYEKLINSELLFARKFGSNSRKLKEKLNSINN